MMSRRLPMLLLLLFGLFVLNAGSGMAGEAGCAGGDQAQAMMQADPACGTESPHHSMPGGMPGSCVPVSCMAAFVVDAAQDLDVSAGESLMGWSFSHRLRGRAEPPPVEPPRRRA